MNYTLEGLRNFPLSYRLQDCETVVTDHAKILTICVHFILTPPFMYFEQSASFFSNPGQIFDLYPTLSVHLRHLNRNAKILPAVIILKLLC